MPETINVTSEGFTRRTALKAAAWSAPVIAVAVAAPLAAASTAGADLDISSMAGDVLVGFSEDGTRAFELSSVFGFLLTTVGTVPTPAGSTFTASFDSRLYSDLVLRIDQTDIAAQSTVTSGNVTTAIFVIPNEIPANGATLQGRMIIVANRDAFYLDIEPNTVSIAPPTGTDPDPTNNGWVLEARYSDAFDAAVSATWRDDDLPISDGAQETNRYRSPATVTITANNPGAVPTGGTLTVGGPDDVTAGASLTAAALNSVDVMSSVGPLTQSPDRPESFNLPINTAIPAGQSLVLTFDFDLEAIGSGENSNGWVSYNAANFLDRDGSNNSASPTP